MPDPVPVIAAPLVNAVEGTQPTVSKPLCDVIGSAKRFVKLAKLLGKFFSSRGFITNLDQARP
jgi:hypothetical protein